MKKVFIDGGAHEGESVDLFFKSYPDAQEYEIHSFEPNPDMHELLEKKRTILHKVGLWGGNEQKEFFKGKFSEGSTFLKMKVSGKVDYNNPIMVECVCLSEWIRGNFNRDDYIVLKLDIEGAEYSVLDDMINTGTIHWINELLGELHGTGPDGRIRSLSKDIYYDMVKKLGDLNIELKDWHNNVKSRF